MRSVMHRATTISLSVMVAAIHVSSRRLRYGLAISNMPEKGRLLWLYLLGKAETSAWILQGQPPSPGVCAFGIKTWSMR